MGAGEGRVKTQQWLREETGGRSEVSEKQHPGSQSRAKETGKQRCLRAPHGLLTQEKITPSRPHCFCLLFPSSVEREIASFKEKLFLGRVPASCPEQSGLDSFR